MGDDQRDLVAKGDSGKGSLRDGALTPTNVVVSTRMATAPRRRREVLKEEEYLSTLGAILRRDFFPSLARLEAQYEYLTAMERADLEAVREAAQRLNALEAGTATTTGTGTGMVEAPRMSLDEFQARYVTEDTNDFEDLLERINALRRQRFAKMFKTPALAGGSTFSAGVLLAAGESAPASSRARVRPSNTAIAREIELGVLERDPTDLRHHYWRMLKEYGQPDDEGRSVTASSSIGGVSQMGGVGEYDFVETPLSRPDVATTPNRPFTIPPTPQRELVAHRIATDVLKGSGGGIGKTDRRSLLKSPAVRRLLRAHTPTMGSAFDIPRTPKRPK